MTYNKNTIKNFIEGYYLNGLIYQSLLTSENGNMSTVFKNSEGNLRGEIKINDIKLPDGKIGVYNTDKLLKMMSILENDIEVVYNGKRDDDGSIISLEMKDNKGRQIFFGATALGILDYDGKTAKIKQNEISLELTSLLIDDLLKSFAASTYQTKSIEEQTFTIQKKKNTLLAVFGYEEGSQTDKIEIPLPDAVIDEDYEDEIISFPAKLIKEILTVNKSNFDKASLEISQRGIMTLTFEKTADLQSNVYWIIKNK